ncbi:hypothetical protein BDR04DRAFT_1095583 [Suillus decipiens]|nr:hypothetical protein BDR04DRAFT_1095583 [Suillus decipiens]
MSISSSNRSPAVPSTTRKSHTLVFSINQRTMDSFSNMLAMLSVSKAENESPTSSTPVEEESQSGSGGCYCIIA